MTLEVPVDRAPEETRSAPQLYADAGEIIWESDADGGAFGEYKDESASTFRGCGAWMGSGRDNGVMCDGVGRNEARVGLACAYD